MLLAVVLVTRCSCPVAPAGFTPGQGSAVQRNKNGILVVCYFVRELYCTVCAERSATHRECTFISKL
jgi:hypothetical protein